MMFVSWMYMTVVRSFEGDASKHQLSLSIGQPVFVKATLGGWAKGSVYPDPHKRGFFPEECVYFFDIQAAQEGKKLVIPIPGEEDSGTHESHHLLHSAKTMRRKANVAAGTAGADLKPLPNDIHPEEELMLSDTDPMGWWLRILTSDGGKEMLEACSDWSCRIDALLKVS